MTSDNPLNNDGKTIEQIAAAIKSSQKILMVAHPRMDGDALGSMLGLCFIINQKFSDKHILLVTQTAYADELNFLPSKDLVEMNTPAIDDFNPDTIIALDSGGLSRVNDVVGKFKPKVLINIDHHATNDLFGTLNFNRTDMSSVGEMIYFIADYLGWVVTRDAAECLFTAILTDTGNFTYSNTKSSSFAAASELQNFGASPEKIANKLYRNNSLSDYKLEARVVDRIELHNKGMFVISYFTEQDITDLCCDLKDTNGLINKLKSIRGTQIAALVTPGLVEGTVKVSLRGEGFHDLSAIARDLFDGGGHPRASGFTYHGTTEQALREITKKVAPLCDASLQQNF